MCGKQAVVGQKATPLRFMSAKIGVVKSKANHGREAGDRVAIDRCREALPCSQRLAASVVSVKVACAYVRKQRVIVRKAVPHRSTSGKGRVVQPRTGTKEPEDGEGVVHHRCRKVLPYPQRLAASVVTVKAAGAYVQNAARCLAESGSSPLNIGGRKSRRAKGQSRARSW
jgi:hypothetical protein